MKSLKIKKLLTVFSTMALFSCGNNDPYSFLNPKLPYEQSFKFDKAGNKGVATGLNAVMKLKDGEPLGGASASAEDFDDDFEDEDIEK